MWGGVREKVGWQMVEEEGSEYFNKMNKNSFAPITFAGSHKP